MKNSCLQQLNLKLRIKHHVLMCIFNFTLVSKSVLNILATKEVEFFIGRLVVEIISNRHIFEL